ncbi:hypothetical protein BX070DRAFT_237749 [Coemansia spiralis]|nr:hypothetical protein BX070DRAFT_237749 [Coemansia spiralis]
MPKARNQRELPQDHHLHQRFFGTRSNALLPIRRELIDEPQQPRAKPKESEAGLDPQLFLQQCLPWSFLSAMTMPTIMPIAASSSLSAPLALCPSAMSPAELEPEPEPEPELELATLHHREPRSAISISSTKWNAAMSSNAEPIKLAYLNVDQFYTLQKLVREHSENWDLIGRVMGIRPIDLEKNWAGYSPATKITRQWTKEEMELLSECRNMGIYHRHQAAAAVPAEDAQAPGHSPPAEAAQVTDIVEQQIRTSGHVDWALVSQQSGVPLHRCWELNRFSDTKARWTYTPNFDWALAHTMRQFIVQFYPGPKIDFAAVSNFLWINQDDCTKMFGVLQGRVEWTHEVVEMVTGLRAQGWSSEMIAGQLSPAMTGEMFEREWQQRKDANPLVPREIDTESLSVVRAVVEDNNGGAAEMIERARGLLPNAEPKKVGQTVLALLSVHPRFESRRTKRIRNNGSDKPAEESPQPAEPDEKSGSRWTRDETLRLIQYVRATKGTKDWVAFAQSLGTKTPYQCTNKCRSLRRHGKLK